MLYGLCCHDCKFNWPICQRQYPVTLTEYGKTYIHCHIISILWLHTFGKGLYPVKPLIHFSCDHLLYLIIIIVIFGSVCIRLQILYKFIKCKNNSIIRCIVEIIYNFTIQSSKANIQFLRNYIFISCLIFLLLLIIWVMLL
jgi:hypothetical protein